MPTKEELKEMIELGVVDPHQVIQDSIDDIVDPDNEYFVKQPLDNVKGRQKRIAIAAMAKEYLRDFDYKKAAARANIPQSKARALFMDRLFLQTVQEFIDLHDEDLIVERREVLFGFRKEAFNDNNSPFERMQALKELARLTNMDPAILLKHEVNAPIVNVTLVAPEGEKPVKPIPVSERPQSNGQIIELNADGSEHIATPKAK